MKERRKRENSRNRRREKKEEKKKKRKKMWFCEPAVSSSRSGWADINAQPTHPLCQLVRMMMIKNTHYLNSGCVEGFGNHCTS